jgi:hypothetical protein
MRIDAATPTLSRSLEIGSIHFSPSLRGTADRRYAVKEGGLMSDQISPSRTWTPPLERGRRRAGPERPANRAVGAAIVAGGLALSVSLYPLPGGPRLLYPFQPEQETSTQSAKVVESTFLNVTFVDFATLKLPDLVKLVEYGLPDVVRSLQLLGSLGPLGHSSPGVSGGGGGDSSGGE